MGFFTFTQRSQVAPESNVTYDESYIKNALRLPSAREEYENSNFNNHFSDSKAVNNPFGDEIQQHKSHRFSRFFRRREKRKNTSMSSSEEQSDHSKIPLHTKDRTELYQSVRISSREVASDENSIIQDSKVEESLGKRRRSSWKSKRRSENKVDHNEKLKEAPSVKSSGFRSYFREPNL